MTFPLEVPSIFDDTRIPIEDEKPVPTELDIINENIIDEDDEEVSSFEWDEDQDLEEISDHHDVFEL